MIKSLDLKKLGVLSDYLVRERSENRNIIVLSTEASELSGLILEVNNIKKVVTSEHTSFTLPVKLKNSRSQSFQNLTIDQSQEKTIAFITTYYPDIDWIKRSIFNKNLPFVGKVQIRRLNLVDNSSKKTESITTQSTSCYSYALYNGTVNVNCFSGQHAPGDSSCIYTGSQAAYSYDTYAYINICVPQEKVDVIFSGGGGGGGGGPATTTNYPSNYNPCPSRGEVCEDDGEYISPSYVANLRWGLGLGTEEVQWLQAHLNRAQEIHKYLQLTNYESAPILDIANAHLNQMIINSSYLTFVGNYKLSNSTTTAMWWQNKPWVQNSNNFILNMEVPDAISDTEFAAINLDPIDAFNSSKITTFFKVGIHKAIMNDAATDAGFCQSNINAFKLGVEWTDVNTLGGSIPNTSYLHFDGLTNYNAVLSNYNIIKNQVQSLKGGIVDISDIKALGFYLHGLQDFYAHSNYVELAIGHFNRGDNLPTYTEVLNNPSNYGTFLNLLQSQLRTGVFDLYSHFFSDLYRTTNPTTWHLTHAAMNKDDALGKTGKLAAALAYKETFNWINNLSNKCN